MCVCQAGQHGAAHVVLTILRPARAAKYVIALNQLQVDVASRSDLMGVLLCRRLAQAAASHL